MHHPYQCLATCRPSTDGPHYLLAASGHKLFSVGLEDGIIVSRWPKTDENDIKIETPEATESEMAGPPTKKRRLSVTNDREILPNIIKLAVTHSQQHVVVVTGEDKCIRVFYISPQGQLSQLSMRAMPKRPCALAFTSDDSEIFCADKFGDVYSLPLLLDPDKEAEYIAAQQAAALKEASEYAPAATELTVHSAANRRALENQLQQAKEKANQKLKEWLPFSHQLLLGHVSLLTDMLVTTIRTSEEEEKPRTYILTSDRDEHIRVSRGPPQAFVIEGYCLGHHEFVNKLCLAEPGVLVSGGGDRELIVWDWLRQKAVNRIDILDAVKRARLHVRTGSNDSDTSEKQGEQASQVETGLEEKDSKLAVSGLWLFADASLETEPQLLITCEGVPAVLYIPVAALHNEDAQGEISFLPLDGNPLDVVSTGNTLLVSTDNIHCAGSTTDIETSEAFRPRLQAFQALGEELGGAAVFKPDQHLNNKLVQLNEQSTVGWHEKALQTLLYSVENLRKRAGVDDSGTD
ncbi:uncharacterized protein PV09_07494 [Verruconis gallopava]|uniref:Uncharacterized protein n=1 Tax=Verruconis gallopava TaxID=253628 RepID=A0A0D1YJC4_9PEZI|nr:uncharacterized protein PV09_07494 [Verruconis gallopava]KIW00972.1 hypothetical protein PV09_07494 [Verruconis gallopava]